MKRTRKATYVAMTAAVLLSSLAVGAGPAYAEGTATPTPPAPVVAPPPPPKPSTLVSGGGGNTPVVSGGGGNTPLLGNYDEAEAEIGGQVGICVVGAGGPCNGGEEIGVIVKPQICPPVCGSTPPPPICKGTWVNVKNPDPTSKVGISKCVPNISIGGGTKPINTAPQPEPQSAAPPKTDERIECVDPGAALVRPT